MSAAILGTALGLGKTLGISLGPKPESAADKSKQQIQQRLSDLGYPEFSSMSGFQGNEKAKRDAVALILSKIQQNPDNAELIKSYLEGGDITPGTVQKTRQIPAGTVSPIRQTDARTAGNSNQSRAGVANLPGSKFAKYGLVIGAVIMIFYLVTQS